MTSRILVGDCLPILKRLPSASVQCVVTSPPYWGLRDYGADGQIGREETPAKFVAKMVRVFRAVRRVLREDGTLWLNLGDTYIDGRGGGIGKNGITSGRNHAAAREALAKRGGNAHRSADGLKPKDLAGIPWRVALALQADGWWLRSEIIWHKLNPMPESVTDRPTKSHEQIFMLAKSEVYHYDAEAIREPQSELTLERFADGREVSERRKRGDRDEVRGFSAPQAISSDGKRNKRDVWSIATQSFSGAHFATFPPKLIEPCILAGCPEGGTVLDPFAGAGTTGLVASRLGRSFIGVELNPAYAEMARQRIVNDAPLLTAVEVA